jgi:hypothetical protein
MGAGPRDRKTTVKERVNPTHPVQPLNFNVLYGFDASLNAFDLYWDDPAQLCNNGAFTILGVNIYRSYDSEFGPYERLNAVPLGSGFYRDETINQLVTDEDVSGQFLAFGPTDDESGRYIFRTQNYPIVKPESEAVPADYPTDVTVEIDGVEVVPLRVYGPTGEIELSTEQFYDVATNKQVDAILPRPDSTVTCTYRYNINLAENQLGRQVFYRITTVGTRDEWDGELRETPLEWTDAKSVDHIENLDYIWREAIRRNSWILDQGGERVKVFIRKWNGERCTECFDNDYEIPRNDCLSCYGTGIEGGYEGPFEIRIGPPDSEKRINYDQYGFNLEQIYQVWTGPSPMLSQRDFIVKQNNDRYSIGPVTAFSNRGNILQQEFQIDVLDENDIRYRVPVAVPSTFPETRTQTWDDPYDENNYPQITEDPKVPDQIEERGRTPTYENINHKG